MSIGLKICYIIFSLFQSFSIDFLQTEMVDLSVYDKEKLAQAHEHLIRGMK